MAAAPQNALHFEQADQRYVLTNRGRLFVAYNSTEPGLEGETCWREVSLLTLSLRILYTELARFIEPREEPEP